MRLDLERPAGRLPRRRAGALTAAMRLSLIIVLVCAAALPACAGVATPVREPEVVTSTTLAQAPQPAAVAVPATPPSVEPAVIRVAGTPRGNVRQLTADQAFLILKDQNFMGAQLSSLRPPQQTQLGDFVACLRTFGEKGGTFAVFYEDGKVSEIRRAVVVDHCETADYAPLPRPRRPKKDDDDDTKPPDKPR